MKNQNKTNVTILLLACFLQAEHNKNRPQHLVKISSKNKRNNHILIEGQISKIVDLQMKGIG